MKMILAIVQADDAPAIMEALLNSGHRVTRVATSGGWLRRENVTLLLGVEDAQVKHVLEILQQMGRHRSAYMSVPIDMVSPQEGQLIEVEVGGATVFVLNVQRFERL